MIKCLIIDDEPLAREGLADYVAEIPFMEVVGTCRNALEAYSQIEEKQVDLLFLDINMPKLSGMDFLKSLKNPPAVIFTTAYREFAIESYELDAIDYLVKPISFQRFLKACNKAKSQLATSPKAQETQSEEKHFFIKEDGKLIKILMKDILFVEGLKDYVFIHTAEEKHITLLSLKQVEQQLPENFLRVHRSFIVALDKVEQMEGNTLKMAGKEVPVSRAMKDEVYEKLIGGKLWKRE